MADGGVASLQMNLADAYPTEANLQSWTRRLHWTGQGGEIQHSRIEFALKGNTDADYLVADDLPRSERRKTAKLRIRFPRADDKPGTVIVEFDPTLLTANVETIKLTNAGLASDVGPGRLPGQLLKTRQPIDEWREPAEGQRGVICSLWRRGRDGMQAN